MTPQLVQIAIGLIGALLGIAGYQEMVGSQGIVYAPTNPAGCGRSAS